MNWSAGVCVYRPNDRPALHREGAGSVSQGLHQSRGVQARCSQEVQSEPAAARDISGSKLEVSLEELVFSVVISSINLYICHN